MAQVCRVCSHPKTRQMEQEYVSGKPKTSIARKHGINVQSVDYHMDNHLTKKLVRSVQEKEKEHTEGILEGIEGMLDETKGILRQAKADGHKRLALDAIGQGTRIFELLSKIAVKLQEYQKTDEEKEDSLAEQQISKGLQHLSDDELKCLIQLTGKVYSVNPEYELDQQSRYVVEAMNILQSDINKNNNSSDPDSSWNGKRKDRNSPESGSTGTRKFRRKKSVTPDEPDVEELELDDLDDLDLNLSSDNTIPSSETDPKWLRRERKRNGLY